MKGMARAKGTPIPMNYKIKAWDKWHNRLGLSGCAKDKCALE